MEIFSIQDCREGFIGEPGHKKLLEDWTTGYYLLVLEHSCFSAKNCIHRFHGSCPAAVAALYVLLKPVNPALALLGAFWRLGNAIVLGVSVALSLAALDLLGGAHYLKVFNADQLQAQAKFFLDMHETGSLVGLVFFSLGAAVHSYLLIKSAYISRLLSGLYLFGAVWLLLCCFGFIIAPNSMTVFNTAFIVPDFVAELLVALWLTCKGAKVPQPVDATERLEEVS